MKYYKNGKLFSYEHYITQPSASNFFPRILTILSWFLAAFCALLILFLFFSPSSNNFILKEHVRHQHQSKEIQVTNFRGN